MVVVDGIPGWYYCQSFWKFAVERAPENGHLAEAGVLFGSASQGLAKEIAASGKTINLSLVDAFMYKNISLEARRVIKDMGFRADDAGFRNTFEHFRKERAHKLASVVVGESPSVVSAFADGTFSMVMLDNNHTDEHLRVEIEAWSPKIAPGGILAAKVAGYLDGKLNQHKGVQVPMRDAFGPTRLVEFDEIVWYATGF